MLSKKYLEELKDKRSIENKLSLEIKKDMSILAERFAYPNNEYIVLPEFNIDDGRVDFIILTGRSRMKVHLIEIKGSEFPFIKKTMKIHSNVGEGIQQLNSRKAYMERNFNLFAKKLHDIRKKIEDEIYSGNYLLGDAKRLLVDPEKGFVISNLIFIGGYSVNDMVESNIRDEFERTTNYQLRVHNWDSFINQLHRE